MSEQHRWTLQCRAFFVFGSLLSLLPASAVAGEIDACMYLVVTDFTSDPYGIAKQLRAEAGAEVSSLPRRPAICRLAIS